MGVDGSSGSCTAAPCAYAGTEQQQQRRWECNHSTAADKYRFGCYVLAPSRTSRRLCLPHLGIRSRSPGLGHIQEVTEVLSGLISQLVFTLECKEPEECVWVCVCAQDDPLGIQSLLLLPQDNSASVCIHVSLCTSNPCLWKVNELI